MEEDKKGMRTFAAVPLPKAINQTDDAYKMHIKIHINTHFYSLTLIVFNLILILSHIFGV